MISLYMDVHVPQAITAELRQRSVDVMTAQDDGARELDDEDLLERAAGYRRVFVTQDKDFLRIGAAWQRAGKFFAGIFFGDQFYDIGVFVVDLELRAKASDPAEWESLVTYIPFPPKT